MNSKQRRTAGWVVAGVVAAGAAIALIFAVFSSSSSSKPDDPRTTVAAFLESWRLGQPRNMNRLVATPAPLVAATYQQQHDAFGDWPIKTQLRSLKANGSRATAKFETTFRFQSGQRWSYRGVLALNDTDRGWRVAWNRQAVHPLLTKLKRFQTSRVLPTRAPILAENDTPLTVAAPVVTIGIEPRRMSNRAATIESLTTLVPGVDPNAVAAKLDAPGVQPDHFVEITTIPDAQYQSVRPQLYPVPGLVFRTNTRREAATPQLGVHVVGHTGPITAELLKELGPSYVTGDIVGLDGLERVYEKRLAGTAAHDVDLVSPEGVIVDHLATLSGVAPELVRTTLDLGTQRAAESAVGATSPAALVALRPSDGAVRAVVSTPIDQPFNRALDGQYPPGSTFKVVTTAALFDHGTTEDSPATCPPTITVGGREFKNFEGEAEPALPFSRAFAISCNTAFIGLAKDLPTDALGNAATAFGFGTKPDLAIAAKGGSFPAPKDPTEQVAAAIGQGRVVASPLAMAGVASTVANGNWHSPTLILEPARPSGPAPGRVPPTTTDALRTLMTGVVQTGTGTAAAIPGQPIAGKTGTAEFGTDTPPQTHAWFIGFRNDLAFAVLVEGGGVGGRVAAPIARNFLAATP
ncbi:MAG: penicillin-binding protein [Acidimicrobiia bacterium]|nr:penicillin-binding protein [Acidimicrobiia bacterium]